MGNTDYTRITAGKGVKDNNEATQIIAKYTREKGKEREHFGTVVARDGGQAPQAAEEDKKAIKLVEDYFRKETYKVDREGEKIYIDSGSEKVRVYDPKNVAEVPGSDGKYDVMRK